MENTPFDNLSDCEVMGLVTRGRKQAFVALVRRHQQPLLNFFRKLGVYNDAEDMVQDTFVRLFKYRKRYKPTAKFTTFLYLMARQVRIDALRKLKRRQDLTKRFAEHMAVEQAAQKASREIPVDMGGLLDRLPEKMRMVVVMSIVQGLRYDEISDILDVPLGTVKSRMFHALRKMREDLNEAS